MSYKAEVHPNEIRIVGLGDGCVVRRFPNTPQGTIHAARYMRRLKLLAAQVKTQMSFNFKATYT